jgi:integrase/recombinase XerD
MTSQKGPASSDTRRELVRFGRHLSERGYKKKTCDQYLSMCRKFSEYLGAAGIDLGKVHERDVESFLSRRVACGRRGRRPRRLKEFWRSPLSLFLDHLRARGVLPPAPPPATATLIPELEDYLAFLREHRGLCERTVDRHRLQINRLLAGVPNLRRLTIDRVDRHLVTVAKRLGRQSIGGVCSAIRGFLRRLHVRGILPVDLCQQVTTPRIYALESLPRAIPWSEIERMLSSIDRATAIGSRDYAMLALVAYSGLRAGDVAALRLGDIDWRRDILHAPRPKQRTKEPIPLVPAIGEALMAYLRLRPPSKHDEIFLKHNAPVAPLVGVQVSQRARQHLKRAGVTGSKLGSHTLRHSFAVEMLRRGHSPRAIGDVLGHAHPQSTYVYLKAAVDDLRDVALEIGEVAR